MASIREIARLINVSPATVSKVVNGRPGVHVETTRMVRQALEKANYQPASKAIDWDRILVVVPNYPGIFIHGTYISTIVAGVAEQALSAGMSISLKKLPANIETVSDLKQMLLQDGSGGIILLALRDGYRFADLLGVEKLPHVIVGETRHQHEVNQIVLDDALSAARATEFLIEQGHTRLGVILGHRSEIGHLQRLHAAKQVMNQMLGKKGILYDTHCLGSDAELNKKAFCELYDRPDPPTAIICFDHPAAIGILQEAKKRGIAIPEQLSLISYVNDGTPVILDTALTSLYIPTYDMGRQAVCMLQKQLAREQVQSEGDARHQTTSVLPSRWVPGATTASLAEEIDSVQLAMEVTTA